ncbi:MAG TPA: ABC transporter substrate-binding protein [Chloroflexota bacterium]
MDKLRINSFGRGASQDIERDRRIYESEGIELDQQVTQSSKQQMQELVDGVWDVVHTNADNVFWWAHDRGADIVIVLATPGRPNQDLVVRPDISRYEDLRGKMLAVDAAESGFATPLRLLLAENGLLKEDSDYRFVEVGATGQRANALLSGQAFGAMIGAGQYPELREHGCKVLDTINRLFTNYAGSAAVRRSWARDHEELLVRYLRAHLRSTEAAASSGDSAPFFSWDGLQEMMDVRVRAGLIPAGTDVRPFANDTYFQTALASL